MYISDLIDVLLEVERDYGNQNLLITTENESELYNSCDIEVLEIDEKFIIKVEANGDNELLPIKDEDEDIEE
jgi:hypothetical protein